MPHMLNHLKLILCKPSRGNGPGTVPFSENKVLLLYLSVLSTHRTMHVCSNQVFRRLSRNVCLTRRTDSSG